jgi:hypothetical protein
MFDLFCIYCLFLACRSSHRERATGECNTLFSKRIEFYKFIYLNKHLIVAFHADAYFPLCDEVFLYYIV